MESYSVTCHPTQVNMPALTSARQAGTQFAYGGEMEGRAEFGSSVHRQSPIKY